MSQEINFNERFKDVEYLKRGGFGSVYSVVCVDTNERRAIKLTVDDFERSDASGSQANQDMSSRRERELYSENKNENFVQYFASWNIETSDLGAEWTTPLKHMFGARYQLPRTMTAIELELCDGKLTFTVADLIIPLKR